MKNIEKYKNELLKEFDLSIACSVNTLRGCEECNGKLCGNCNRDALKWLLADYKEPVLDEVERKYLSDVIRPFKGIVRDIKKEPIYGNSGNEEYISIEIQHESGFRECVNLPNFGRNVMYKGMELNKKYTLKELGL